MLYGTQAYYVKSHLFLLTVFMEPHQVLSNFYTGYEVNGYSLLTFLASPPKIGVRSSSDVLDLPVQGIHSESSP